MKNICFVLLLSSFINLNAQITINEILFEEPIWNTNLVYLELLNYSEIPVNLSEWSISGDLTLPSFPNINLLPGERYVICSDFDALFAFGLTMSPGQSLFFPSNLDFSMPNFILRNPDGEEVSRIEYNPNLGWPIPEPGVSIELCDPTLDINNGLNWSLAEVSVAVGNNEILGTPGKENTCSETSTSSMDINLFQQISIYPNPSNSILNIMSEGIVESVNVCSIAGTQLLEVSNSKFIDVSSLNAGLYNIQIISNGKRSSHRFVKL